MGFRLAPSKLTLDNSGVKGQRQNYLIRNISKTATDMGFDPMQHLYSVSRHLWLWIGTIRFDLRGHILFDVKNAENGKRYNVGLN